MIKAAYLPYSGAAPSSVENLNIIVLPSVHLTYVFRDIFRFAHSEEQSFTSTMKIDANELYQLASQITPVIANQQIGEQFQQKIHSLSSLFIILLLRHLQYHFCSPLTSHDVRV